MYWPVRGAVSWLGRTLLVSGCLISMPAWSWAGGAAAPEPTGASKASTNPDEGAARGNLVGHGGPVKTIAIDTARRLGLTGSFDYAMMAWDLSADRPRETQRFDNNEGAVNAVAFVPNSRLAVSAGDDGALSLWDLDNAKLLHRFNGHTAKVVDIAVSDDGVWAITASWDRTARLWNLKTHTAGPVLDGHKGPVNAVALSEDGKQVFTASYDGAIRMFKADTGDLIRPVFRHGWGINVLKRIPKSSQLVFGALNGTAAHAFCHILYKALLFMSMGAVLLRAGTVKGSELGGLFKSMPWTTGFCIVGAASISAFPLFSGFVSKSMIITASTSSTIS